MPDTNFPGARFTVADMSCGHCVGVIRDALRDGLPGVAATVDLGTKTVTVDGDAAQAAAIIRDAGYEPVAVA